MHRHALALLVGLMLVFAPQGAAARADFQRESPSAPAQELADWAVHSGDPGGRPFAIVDKVHARVFVFDGAGRLLGAAAALLGLARGDASVAGIGQRRLSEIRPEERTTPAGRFVATLASSLTGEDILWIDYENAVALHRVVDTGTREQRLRRLDRGTPAQRRITYGCINVPVRFFEDVVAPAFLGGQGIVYVLPESGSWRAVFGRKG